MSETSTEERNEPTDEGGEPEHINAYAPEVDALAAQAESLHLPENAPMATEMQTQERTYKMSPFLPINPVTGHVMDMDPQDIENIRQAMGPDRADPPTAE
jgi:hypothetical protein